MSQHKIETVNSVGYKVFVTIGYDRRLDCVHCVVHGFAGEVLYSNLDDDDAGTSLQDVRYYEGALESVGIRLPDVIYDQVVNDQLGRIGNRLVIYNQDGYVARELGG